MNLPGKLGPVTLGDVLGALHRERATGVLELTEMHGSQSGRVHRIHLEGGLVGHVESGIAQVRFGEVLREIGVVDDAVLRRLSERLVRSSPKLVGQVLLEMGVIGTREVTMGLRVQRRYRLERLFRLEGARLAFRVARAGSGNSLPPLEPTQFLHGRSRARATTERAGVRRDPVRARALSTLGLPDGVGADEVRRAFRKLAATMHPDRFPTAGEGERATIMRRFAELSAAYHVLVA
ncbi:MAG TPA: J domain-containing protein [Polyangiaceae bacterium]|jgi:hypothetical protein|nr:J domain-containing protein [Polyangiaceae bacterium]